MQKIFVVLIVLLFGFCTIGFSETIYLKSGGKIEGDIVNESEDKVTVKVKIGTMTVERDNIERIEGRKEEIRQIKPTVTAEGPEEIGIEIEPGSPADAYIKWVRIMSEVEKLEDFKDYVSKEAFDEMMSSAPQMGEAEKVLKMIKAMTARDIIVISQEIDEDKAHIVAEGTTWMGRARGEIEMVFEDGGWRLQEEHWKSGNVAEVVTEAPAPKGFGTVSGAVTLPAPAKVPEKGNIFVILRRFGEMHPSVYSEIPLSSVVEGKVSYEFNHVPSGEYYVSAIWDAAEPYIDLEKTVKDAGGWGMQTDNPAAYIVGLNGDYKGDYGKSIDIRDGVFLTDIDFECSREIEMTSWSDDEGRYGTDYTLSNLRFIKDSLGGPKLLVDVTDNEKEKEIAQVNLMVFINGWMTNYFKAGTAFIKPGETIEFELFKDWDDYTLAGYYGDQSNRNLPRNKLSIHVISGENGSHTHSVINISDEIIAKLDADKWSSKADWEPTKWGIPYKIIDVRVDKQKDGTKKYYLKAKNESDGPIESFQIFVVVEGELYNIGHTGPAVFGAREEKEFDITSAVNSCLEKIKEKGRPTDRVTVRIINKENDGYFEKLLEP